MLSEQVWNDARRQISSARAGFRIENDGRTVEVMYGGGYRLYRDWKDVGITWEIDKVMNFLRYGKI